MEQAAAAEQALAKSDTAATAFCAVRTVLECIALPIAEHRDALAAEVARLREALEKRYAAGHNDTCAAMLGDYACSCGHDGLLEATAKGAGR